MKLRVCLIFFAACAPRYTLELRAESTPPLTATIGTSVQLYEGTAVQTRVGVRENGELLRSVTEDDLVVSAREPSIVRVLAGPKALDLVLLGLTPGTTVLEVRYKGRPVDVQNVDVLAQADGVP